MSNDSERQPQDPVAHAWFHRGMVNFDAEDSLSLLDDGKGTAIDLFAAPSSQLPPLTDDQMQMVRDAVAEAIGCFAYDCRRVWNAWNVGTMGQDDFYPIADDPERVAEITDAAINAIAQARGEK